jgi:hypothetical protein
LISKTMAKVREEQGKKKSILQRLFFPLAVKVPLQTVAVLFLAVTAFYIYEGMHSAAKYAEAPVNGLAGDGAPAPEERKLEKEQPAAPGTKIAQTPGYRSLDMKDEYERPSSPVPAAPQPAPAAKVGTAARQNRASRPAPPQAMAEQAGGAVRSFEPKRPTGTEEHFAGTPPLARDNLLRREKKAGNEESADEDQAMHAVTAYFREHDLRQNMKVRGLQYVTRELPDDLVGVEWLAEMQSYRMTPCRSRYIVDVEISGVSSKYLYCYDSGRVRPIGVYDLVSAVWVERK